MKSFPIPKTNAVALLQQQAKAARQRMDYRANFDLLREAHALDTRDAGLLIDLGTAHGRLSRFPEALACFNRAVDESREKPRILAIVAQQCRRLLRPDLAEHFLARAAQEPGVSPETLAALAEIKERMRESHEAESAVDRALKADPKCPLALLVRARLHRTAGRLDEAEKLVRSFLSRTDRSGWPFRIRGSYELATILDRQGRYDEAFAALEQIKKMLAPMAAGEIAQRRITHQSLLQTAHAFNLNHLKRWRQADPHPAGHRLAVIAGHPRSGTTLLEQVLDAHSGVISAEETTLFLETYADLERSRSPAVITTLDSLSPEEKLEARESYFRRMESFVSSPVGDRLLIDKNPSLTALIPAILCLVPGAKIIVALRDPRDVCLSCFFQYLGTGPVAAMFLTLEGVVEEYCSVMNFWLSIKPQLSSSALEIRYEDVVDDLAGEAQKTIRFLDLEWESSVLNYHERAAQKLVRSPSYTEVARPISRGAIGRWRLYRNHLQPSLAKLAPIIKAVGYAED